MNMSKNQQREREKERAIVSKREKGHKAADEKTLHELGKRTKTNEIKPTRILHISQLSLVP